MTESLSQQSAHPFRQDGNLGFNDYAALSAYGAGVEVPAIPDRHRIALELICSRGVPCYLTPYGAIRAVAAFAIDAVDDPFYNDGEVLFKAALRARRDGHHTDALALGRERA